MKNCLINQSACGRIQGKPVCPKCGMDERVVYPGQADREAAQTAGLARYWEAHAKSLEQQVQQGNKAQRATQTPPPGQPAPGPADVPPQTPPAPPVKGSGFKWAWVPVVLVDDALSSCMASAKLTLPLPSTSAALKLLSTLLIKVDRFASDSPIASS